MNGAAIILLGLVAYGTLHIHHGVLQAWQWCARSRPVVRVSAVAHGRLRAAQAHDHHRHNYFRDRDLVLVRGFPASIVRR